jgi:restriction endonuclease Mrr
MNADINNPSQITAIRDILFGNNMQAYEAEFNAIKDLVAQNKATTDEQLQQQLSQINESLNNLEQRLMLAIKKNHEEVLEELRKLDNAKLDKVQLGKMFIEIGNKISI